MDTLSDVMLSVLSAIGGVGALIFGLAGFLKASLLARQQAGMREALEETKGQVQVGLEIVKLDLEKLKFAHAKQFEKEFKLYEELWQLLYELSVSSLLLDDESERELSGIKTFREEVKASQNEMYAALEPVATFTENYAPFFHERVHIELRKFVSMCTKAWVNDSFRSLANPGALAPTSSEIGDQLEKICKEIRWRIGLSDMEDYKYFEKK